MKNKTIVITGASGDIGRALARKLAERPYNLVLQYFHAEERARDLAEELSGKASSILLCRADLRTSAGAEKLREAKQKAFGQELYALVNAVGSSYFDLCQAISDAAWRDVMAVNLDSVFYTCRAFVPDFLKTHEGSIVNVSSMWGISGASLEIAYSAAKAGVIGLTKALARELGPSGIRVNAVAPGVIEGRMNRHLASEVLEELSSETVLGRLGRADEIADVIMFLLEDASSYMTAQVLLADGGFLA